MFTTLTPTQLETESTPVIYLCQAYRVNSKCERLSTGSCGSAGSYSPELTTPFHDVDRRRAHHYYICERLSHAAFVES